MNTFKCKICLYTYIVLPLLILLTTCKKTPVEPEPEPVTTAIVSPGGGEYTFSDGIKLTVPAGAVSVNTEIEIRKVGNNELSSIFGQRGVPMDRLLACVEGKPDGLTFSQPVKLMVPVDLEPGEIPVVHEIDLENGAYAPLMTESVGDPEADTLEISISHFSSISAEILKELEELFPECAIDPCRCGRIKVEQSDKDNICDTGECQITESRVSVTFLDCPGQPVEESFLREVSSGCRPKMTLTVGSQKVITENQTSVRAVIELGCEATEEQSVDFSVSGVPGSVDPTYATTDPDGQARTTFTAGDQEGMATVTARSTVSYYTFTVSANAGGVEESENGPLVTEELSRSVNIQIEEPDEVWSGTMSYDYASQANIWIYEEAHYDVSFTLGVTSEGDIIGIATATQTVSVESLVEGWCIQNIDAPAILNLEVDGYAHLSHLSMKLPYPNPPFYTFEDYCCIPECMPPDISTSNGPGSFLVSNILDDSFTFAEGTQTGSYDIIGLAWVNYTITLNKESP
ncbi:hypothetical protein HQ585_15665 [candidate division KSB1 bacterium]|nr:hypothetical protein [candidate division KSB1 bacterium]